MATFEEILQKTQELEQLSKRVDWDRTSKQNALQIITKSSSLSKEMASLNAIDAVQRSFFRYTLLVTVVVLGALLLKVNGTYVAFACCVLTSVWTALLSLVVWSGKLDISARVNELTQFVKQQPILKENDLGEEKE